MMGCFTMGTTRARQPGLRILIGRADLVSDGENEGSCRRRKGTYFRPQTDRKPFENFSSIAAGRKPDTLNVFLSPSPLLVMLGEERGEVTGPLGGGGPKSSEAEDSVKAPPDHVKPHTCYFL